MGFFFLNTWIFPNKTKFCLLYSERNVKKTIEKVSLWNINLWSGYFKAFNISKGRSNFCSSSFSNNENNLLQKSTPSELSRSSGVLWWHDSMLFSIISLWQWSTALSFISRFWQEPSRFHAAVAIQMFSLAPNFLTDFSTEPISKWNESNLDSNRSKWDFKSFFFFFSWRNAAPREIFEHKGIPREEDNFGNRLCHVQRTRPWGCGNPLFWSLLTDLVETSEANYIGITKKASKWGSLGLSVSDSQFQLSESYTESSANLGRGHSGQKFKIRLFYVALLLLPPVRTWKSFTKMMLQTYSQ